MTTAEMIVLVKENLGKEITEKQAQAYLDGKEKLPDELLGVVSGGVVSFSGRVYDAPKNDHL